MEWAANVFCEPRACAWGVFLEDRVLLLGGWASTFDVERTARACGFLLEGEDFAAFCTPVYRLPIDLSA